VIWELEQRRVLCLDYNTRDQDQPIDPPGGRASIRLAGAEKGAASLPASNLVRFGFFHADPQSRTWGGPPMEA